MTLFLVEWDEEIANQYFINATHKWGLPGLRCADCGATWTSTGLQYPSVDLSVLPFEAEYRIPRAVNAEEFEYLRSAVSPLMPDDSIPGPGAEFGPLVGRARGIFGDFAWLNSWTLLATREAYDLLRSMGVKMPKGAQTELTFSRKSSADLLELEILLAGSVILPPPEATCGTCGRTQFGPSDGISLDRLVFDGSSVPEAVDLFRPKNFATLIVATERFEQSVLQKQLRGVVFKPLRVS